MQDVMFVHLSDPHIQPAGETFWEVIDGYDMTRRALEAIDLSRLKPDFLIISGDLAQDGDYDRAYARIRKIVDDIEEKFGVPVLLALGNHDERAVFRRVVLGDDGSSGAKPYYYTRRVAGLKVVVLDSNGYQAANGRIDDEQLDWLVQELREERLPCLVVCHHPPIPTGIERLNGELLSNADMLGDILAVYRDQILGILCGHIHHVNIGEFRGILCSTATGLAFTVDPAVQDRISCLNGSGFNVMHIRNGNLLVNPYDMPGDPIEVASL